MTSACVVVPFRDRGVDPLRPANLQRVIDHWEGFDWPVLVVDDGRVGKASFNRSAAYNRGAAATDASVLFYAESDMLIDYQQVRDAIKLAEAQPGLVVPFRRQIKLTETDSILVRGHLKDPQDCVPGHHPYGEVGNTGCLNVLSRETLAAVGQWDERFEGHGHDDSAMQVALEVCAGPTRFIDGPAWHLYHLDFDPTTTPDSSHITEEDKQAQGANFRRMQQYRLARSPDEVRQLTGGAQRVSNNWRARWLGGPP